jgi:hypothetical protein
MITRTGFPPDLYFHQDLRLVVFRPRGILNQETVLALVRFLEREEDLAKEAFNRFTDTSELGALDLNERFLYRIALHRRRFYEGRSPVKSAFYVTGTTAGHYVRIHAVVTEHSPLRVKMFCHFDDAAKSLGVPRRRLQS